MCVKKYIFLKDSIQFMIVQRIFYENKWLSLYNVKKPQLCSEFGTIAK